MSEKRRGTVVLLKLGILLGFVAIGSGITVLAYPPLAGVLLWLKSRGRSQCSLPETVRSGAYLLKYSHAKDEILASAKMVQQDGNLQLWDIPGSRPFWMSGKFGPLNATAFAEQVAEQYSHPAVHVRPGDIVIDIGADFGQVTWQALRSGAAKVIAIEIAPDKWPCLHRTFAKEIAEGRVQVVQAGVWDAPGILELGADSVVIERQSRKQKVNVTTLDQIVADLRLPRVDFITMDIEGAEKPALRGAQRTLREFRPRMAIAAEHLSDDLTAIPQTVRAIVPEYQVICGRCAHVEGRMMPTVIWFH